MKVIDSFMFFNESNTLKLRLKYLNEIVDYFIISESNYTHSGKPKPYYLDEVLDELPNEIVNKIIRVKYEPDISQFDIEQKIDYCDFDNDFWKLEKTQRNQIKNHLSQFSSNDFLMINDLDEIPRKEVVLEYKEIFENYCGSALPKDFCAVVKTDLFYYNFNTYCRNDWLGSIFLTIETALEKGFDYFRYNKHHFHLIENGGFHFSTFGNVEQIRTKIQSFAHQEFNKEQYISDTNILSSIQNKEDIYHLSQEFVNYNISDFPEDLRNHIINIFPKEMYSL